MEHIQFTDKHGSFTIRQPEQTNYLYFPLASEAGLKSAVTPTLGGDAKIDQETFLLEPVSSENLHNNRSSRNFWCRVEGGGVFSATGASAQQEAAKFTPQQEESELSAGFMWQRTKRTFQDLHLASEITMFIPKNQNVEIMHISIRNLSEKTQELTAYAAIPIYGRSADNIRDHRNVTSMLHRIKAEKQGVFVCPTMSFDEKGHRPNHRIYYAMGFTGSGGAPTAFYPTVEDFIGEGGTFTHPRAVYEQFPGTPAPWEGAGKEAMGAFRFDPIALAPGEAAEYVLLLGAADSQENIPHISQGFHTSAQALAALAETKSYWQEKVNVSFHTSSPEFDSLMKWVSFQPFLRRLFGCSFLPHHDYGRGGRGWRDLWQDCLSLLLLEPGNVRQMIAANYGGVRIDGTNATIIGSGDGNFQADRNGIARVWMDHALWPLITTKLYIHQTGDIGILSQQAPYFKDAQTKRGTALDPLWDNAYGNMQRTDGNEVYTGTILEHLLIQQLTAFYEVGEHNICRLRDADWNDALDMASQHGESVAFTCAYAGNLLELASLIRLLADSSGTRHVELLEELGTLLGNRPETYSDPGKKQETLQAYCARCRHNISGKRASFSLSALALDLTQKAHWLIGHIRSQEWIEGTDGEGWFNSYYDDHGQPVEGFQAGAPRMMLTGQVFAIMGGVAEDAQIQKIVKSADHYLYREGLGGYCLNTDFHELKFDMGRMFGFAYGEKENGSVFSHMAVMYANALYRRGFVREGYKALKSLADAAMNFGTSRIYPGIPEYFRSDGRGMYHYLTGAASWYMMTMITEAFGVRGEAGDLILEPKLLAEQFDSEGTASIAVPFAGKDFQVTYINTSTMDFGAYAIGSATCGQETLSVHGSFAILPRHLLDTLQSGATHQITVQLTEKMYSPDSNE